MGERSGRSTIPADVSLAITLRVFAGWSYFGTRIAFHIGRSTVYHILHDTIDALDEYFSFPGLPDLEEELLHIATGFQMSRRQRKPLPFRMGASDGILIPILKPAESHRPAAYFTRKGNFAYQCRP